MYVCLCKGLTESQVAAAARACDGVNDARPCALLRALNLQSDDACGHCAEDPSLFLSIATEVWGDNEAARVVAAN